MDNSIYGCLDRDDCLIDTALTLRGAKCHATRNGYTKVGRRVGYNVINVWEKVNGKWVEL